MGERRTGQAPLTKAWIRADALGEILRASAGAEGAEPCGVLLGTLEGGSARIRRAPRTRNAHPRPERAFRVAPQELLEIVRAARREGLTVVGFWHGQLEGAADLGASGEEGLEQAETLGGSARLLVVAGHGSGRARVVRAYTRGRHGPKEVPLGT